MPCSSRRTQTNVLLHILYSCLNKFGLHRLKLPQKHPFRFLYATSLRCLALQPLAKDLPLFRRLGVGVKELLHVFRRLAHERGDEVVSPR